MGLGISQKTLNNLDILAHAKFSKGIAQPNMSLVSLLSMAIDSKSSSENYKGINQVPQIEEFKDEVKFKKLLGKDYTVKNKTWTSGVQIERADVEDDKIGMFLTRVQEMGKRAQQFPLKLLIDFINAGEGSTLGVGYDGANFFSTAHEEGLSGEQSNLQDGTGISLAQFEADYFTAKNAMANLKDDSGDPFFGDDELTNMLVIVPSGAIAQTAQKFFGAEMISNTSNVFAKEAQVYVSNRLTAGNDWYLAFVNSAFKPLIWQNRSPIEFTSMLDLTSPENFNNEHYRWKTRQRGNMGYGLFQFIQKIKDVS